MEHPFHPHAIVSDDVQTVIRKDLPWEKFRNKTILISGANGFLPAYMVYTLLGLNTEKQLNLRVIALVRNEERGKIRFQSFLKRPDFQLLVQDVTQPIDLPEDIHFIVHAASQASPKYYGVDPVGTLNANLTGTMNLLSLASRSRTERFLYFSSCEVYGAVEPGNIPTRETDYGYLDPTQVRSCYAESKRMGETICVSWMHQFQLPVVMVRPFHTYGPGMDLNDGRVYADFISDVLAGKDIVMKSDGSAERAFCYIMDATEAFFRVLLEGRPGQAYNVGNDQGESSIIHLAEKLVSLFPEKNLKIIRFVPENDRYIPSPVSRMLPETSKIKQLGWMPETSIEQGFKRTIQSYQ